LQLFLIPAQKGRAVCISKIFCEKQGEKQGLAKRFLRMPVPAFRSGLFTPESSFNIETAFAGNTGGAQARHYCRNR